MALTRRVVVALALFACLAAASGRLEALERPTKAEIDRLRNEGTLDARVAAARALENDRIDPALVQDLQQRLRVLRMKAAGRAQADIAQVEATFPAGERPGLGSKGTKRIFALLLDFSDYPATVPVDSIEGGLFGDGLASKVPYESLRNYYRRSSYGDLELQGATLGYYRTSVPRSSISQTSTARENLIKEALTYFDNQGHDFSQYDNDGDGKIDYFCVFWTGPDNGWANFWWGYYTSWSSTFSLDGKSFRNSRYSWQWLNRQGTETTFTPLVVIHETGHSLGLPDLYDYDGGSGPDGGVGGLDMMDSNWGDHNGFSKMLLDWITPVVTTSGQTYTLEPSGTTRQAAIMWPGFSLSSPFTEFFLIQNRSRVANDVGYPTNGLVIWHIDARLDAYSAFAWDNSYTKHKLVRLMEADGLEQIESGGSAGASDFYGPGRRFGSSTTPNSFAYDGTVTFVGVDSIAANGTAYSFVTGDDTPVFITDTSSLTIAEGGSASFNVKLGTAPPADVSATVARVSGDTDISVVSGASLTFTTSNWSTWQTVTLAAAEDADNLNGTATIRISSATVASRDIGVTELDNDVSAAVYNPTLKVPACASTLAGCDSGTLLRGRDSLSGAGAELHQPNTLYGLCADGTYGSYLTDESVDRIRIVSTDGGPMVPGKSVRVDVDAYVYSTSADFLDLYYTADATVNPPSWTLIATISPSATGSQTLSGTYTLPSGTIQAVRANFRYQGSQNSCSTGSYDDHDDLAFSTSTTPTFALSVGTVSVPEGGTATFQVKLTRAPAEDVTATVARTSGDNDITVTHGGSLVFSTTNWNTWQTVTLAAAEDNDFAAGTASITVTATGIDPVGVTAIEVENDSIQFVTDVSRLGVPEGGSATFNVKLTAAPTFDVAATVVRILGDTDITVGGDATISFTPANWNTWQPVTLVAAADADASVGSAVVRIGLAGVASKDVVAHELDASGQATAAVVRTLAGSLGAPGTGDGLANLARFTYPSSVAVAPDGTVWVSDIGDAVTLRRITTDGLVTTVNSDVAFGRAGLAVGRDGTLYIADYYHHIIKRMAADGSLVTIAGSSSAAGSTDGTGSDARFSFPLGIAVDGAGMIYVSDAGTSIIRRVTPDGVVTTMAGTAGSTGLVDGSGSAARFYTPTGLGVDPDGTLFIADASNAAVRKMTPDGVVSTIHPITSSGSPLSLPSPVQVVPDAAGNLYVLGGAAVYEIAPSGVTTTIAGGVATGRVDSVGALARFWWPAALAVDWNGALLVADAGNCAVRKATFELSVVPDLSSHAVTVVEGATRSVPIALNAPPTGTLLVSTSRFSGDADISVSAGGTLTFTAANWSVPQTVTLGAAADVDTVNSAATIRFTSPQTTALDIEVTEADTAITPDSLVVTTLAGNYSWAYADGTGANARFGGIAGLAFDDTGDLYVSDSGNYAIRKVTSGGVVTTLAGQPGTSGTQDGSGSGALFSSPRGVASGMSYAYVADLCRIRKVESNGAVTAMAGGASCGWVDGAGENARLAGPAGLTMWSHGAVVFADASSHTIRQMSADGTVVTFAGSAFVRGQADGYNTAARFNSPAGVASDADGVIYVTDEYNYTIRRISTSGFVTTLAGMPGVSGSCDGNGSSARFSDPTAIAMSPSGDLYVADGYLIRKVTPDGTVTTVAGTPGSYSSVDGIGYAAGVSARALAVNPSTGQVAIGEYTRVRAAVTFGSLPPAIVTNVNEISVNEGSTATVLVTLASAPTGTVTVDVVVGGDPTLTITSSTPLSFTPSNWNVAQAVTLAAADDRDKLDGLATLTLSAGANVRKDIGVTVVDNDATLAFSNDPLTAHVTPVRSAHIVELRNAIDTLRVTYGLAPMTWTDPVLVPGVTVVKSAHLVDLRAALAELYEWIGFTPPDYATPTATGRPISAADIEELRVAVRAIWG